MCAMYLLTLRRKTILLGNSHQESPGQSTNTDVCDVCKGSVCITKGRASIG
jgi:hypothetical protein